MNRKKIEGFVRDNNPKFVPEKINEAVDEIISTCERLDIDENEFIQAMKKDVSAKSIDADINKLQKEKEKILYDSD